jgi:hypothetical protein
MKGDRERHETDKTRDFQELSFTSDGRLDDAADK